jgi:hypothetical protein
MPSSLFMLSLDLFSSLTPLNVFSSSPADYESDELVATFFLELELA